MTQKEKWAALLTESKVDFEATADGLTVHSKALPDHVNCGYTGFAVDLKFDENGILTEFGIWE